jgi:phosphonate transport system permease protein
LSSPLLQINNLKVAYQGSQGLEFEFSNFSISRGEFIVLTGSSGSGKTTLLRILEGSLKPSVGTAPRVKAAMIYQDLRLISEKTALENVLAGVLHTLKGYRLQFSQDQISTARELLQQVGLANQTDSLVSELSGGQKQRVAIARALMSQPDLLIGDECFSHLDPQTAEDVFALIRSLSKKFSFAFIASMHAPHVSFQEFDRKVMISEISRASASPGRQKFLRPFLVFCISLLSVISLWKIETAGFQWTQGFDQLFSLSKRFVPTSESFLDFSLISMTKLVLQTIYMAFLGSALGFLIALPLSLLSVEKFSYKPLAALTRGLLMFLRATPSIVWALLFVASLGIGSVAGVCALAVYTAGFLGKLIYESFENAEVLQFDALKNLGASSWQSFWFGVFPSTRSTLLSHYLFCLEYNIRSASIMGLVGAGGIGQELLLNIEWRRFDQAGIILLIIFFLVVLTDSASKKLRAEINLDQQK